MSREAPNNGLKKYFGTLRPRGQRKQSMDEEKGGGTYDDGFCPRKETSAKPQPLRVPLTQDEKRFLLSVENGNIANVRRFLQARPKSGFNINCVDPFGRSALLTAIDNENLEMIELLLEHKIETKDALLHAISEEYVEAVEVLLEHEEAHHVPGTPHSWEAVDRDTSTFTPDITPLILAAHHDNFEIIKILLDRGESMPSPHDIKCSCSECVRSSSEDSLNHSRSRLNAYRALASPNLIALSSKDPIETAFELCFELWQLSRREHEYKCEYLDLRKKCMDFPTALLDHTRSSYELEVLLNYDPTEPVSKQGERMTLSRLKLAIKHKQKKFCAHPNVQQLLASIFYDGVPGFRRKNIVLQSLEICRIGMLFPYYSIAYIVAPYSNVGLTLRKPFIKFICHSASYVTFLFLLYLSSQRLDEVIVKWFGTEEKKKELESVVKTKRGAKPTVVEWMIFTWVIGLIWSEVKQLWNIGYKEYLTDMWNIMDFIPNSLYIATIAFIATSYFQVQKERELNPDLAILKRENWPPWDPMLISEGLFALANIFSCLKLVHIFSANPHLGPLQISLGRMVIDIVKFFFVYSLVLFAFACGMNQLLWYYADMEKSVCYESEDPDQDACQNWRRFANLFESAQTLFWATFGLIELDSFELHGIQGYTRFIGLLMFGAYCIINVAVLLNLLIAMMNASYQIISEQADVEWKFARCKLWMDYFEYGGTVPPPLNIFPTPKSVYYIFRWIYRKCCGASKASVKEDIKSRRKSKQESERDSQYHTVVRNLVRRYVTEDQRNADNQGMTEDDVNEIKQDISSLRYELMEILKTSGFNTSACQAQSSAGKKGQKRERRLMKGFDIEPVDSAIENGSELNDSDASSNSSSPGGRFSRIVRLVTRQRKHEKKVLKAKKRVRGNILRKRVSNIVNSKFINHQAGSPDQANQPKSLVDYSISEDAVFDKFTHPGSGHRNKMGERNPRMGAKSKSLLNLNRDIALSPGRRTRHQNSPMAMRLPPMPQYDRSKTSSQQSFNTAQKEKGFNIDPNSWKNYVY